MTPLPTIPDLYRVVILWSPSFTVTPRNVFHVHNTSGDVDAVASALETAFIAGRSPQNMFRGMGSSYSATSVSITPLDGSSAATDHGITAITGGSSGEVIPMASAVVSLKTAQKGARGRGRMYVGPTTEGSQDSGILDSAIQAAMLTGWGNFIASLETDLTPLHVASYTHVDSHEVTSVRIDTLLGTMRRRQDQKR